MTAKNDITGDDIKTKAASNNFRDNFDRIFNGQGISEKSETYIESPLSLAEKLIEAQAYITSALIMLHSMPSRNSVQQGVYQNLLTYMMNNCPEFFDTFKLD